MALREYSGTAKTTSLAGTISASALSINLADASGYPTGAVGPFVVTVDVGLANEEKVLCSSRTGNTLSVATGGRGFDGTTASDHDNSATVQHTFSAVDAREANAHVNDATGDPHPQYLNAAEGVSKAGGDTITASAAGVIPLVVKGAASQTADFFRVADSTNAEVAAISSAQQARLKFAAVGDGAAANFGPGNNVVLASQAPTAASRPLVVRGAASQTANLAEFQNDVGTVLARVRSSGAVEANSGLYTQGPINGSPATGHLLIDNTATNGTTDSKGLVVKGRASQSANLAEFQNSAGTVLTSVDSLGRFEASHGASPIGNLVDAGVTITTRTTASRGLVVAGLAGQTNNLAEFRNSAGTVLTGVDSAGRLLFSSGNVSSTAAAGGASLPASPIGFYSVYDVASAIVRKIPYYGA